MRRAGGLHAGCAARVAGEPRTGQLPVPQMPNLRLLDFSDRRLKTREPKNREISQDVGENFFFFF